MTSSPARAGTATIGYVPQIVSADGVLTGRESLVLFGGCSTSPAPSAERITLALTVMGLATTPTAW